MKNIEGSIVMLDFWRVYGPFVIKRKWFFVFSSLSLAKQKNLAMTEQGWESGEGKMKMFECGREIQPMSEGKLWNFADFVRIWVGPT